jgi:phospholipid/cholesterol/gamma-HCH transport system substrate-binding protein
MVAELTPGHRSAGALKEGGVIPISQTLPDVNLDEILSSLDSDTRDYLQLLLHDGAQGIGSAQKGRQLAAAIRRIDPTAKYARAINEGLAQRRLNIARVVHNFSLLAQELGRRDTQLADFVQNSNAVFASLASQDASLRATLQKLPGALDTTQTTLGKVKGLADQLGPTLQALRPGARALGPSLRQTRPFLRETTPVIRDELRPFSRAALPTVQQLRPAMRDLAAATPDLTRTFKVVNRLLNEIAYNPPGDKEEGYLFWQSWVNHAGNAVFASQDAHGPIRRGLIVLSCNTAQLLNAVSQANPQLGTLVQLLNAPTASQICPKSTQSPAGGG